MSDITVMWIMTDSYGHFLSFLSSGGVLPTVLQEVRVPIMSNDKCKNMFLSAGRHEYIPDIFMCAGYDEGGRDSCQVSV